MVLCWQEQDFTRVCSQSTFGSICMTVFGHCPTSNHNLLFANMCQHFRSISAYIQLWKPRMASCWKRFCGSVAALCRHDCDGTCRAFSTSNTSRCMSPHMLSIIFPKADFVCFRSRSMCCQNCGANSSIQLHQQYTGLWLCVGLNGSSACRWDEQACRKGERAEACL